MEGVEPHLKGRKGPLAGSLRHAMQQVEQAMLQREDGNRLSQNLAVLYWERVVGGQAAMATEADTVRDGILFVNTRNSVWSHELTLFKYRILEDLNRLLKEEKIKDIRFRVRKLKKETPVLESLNPTPEDLKSVVLEPAERSELRERLESLIEIPDDRIREKIAQRLVSEARLRHWRIVHGWKVCRRCSGVHNTEDSLCPICRVCG